MLYSAMDYLLRQPLTGNQPSLTQVLSMLHEMPTISYYHIIYIFYKS